MPGASVAINGTDDADMDTDGHQVDLVVGTDSVITITVTAEDTAETMAYTVTVTRAAITDNNAKLRALSLSDVTLSPAFSSDHEAYTATVPNGVESTTVTATQAVATDDVDIDPVDAAEDMSGHQVSLTAGQATDIMVTVTQGTTPTVYTVTVTRIAADNASLSKLLLDDEEVVVTTDGVDSMTTHDVDADVDSVTVKATAVVGARVTGITPLDADLTMPDHQVSLDVDSDDQNPGTQTPIEVTVLAADGFTTATHTVTVTREASDDATLASLSLSDGALSPAF